MTRKTIDLYKKIFENLKQLRKELLIAKYEVSRSAYVSTYQAEKIKDLDEKISSSEALFSKSQFVVKTDEYLKSCKKLLDEKYSSFAPWRVVDHISFQNGKLLDKVYLIPADNDYDNSILLLHNASSKDEYINIAYTSIMPLTSKNRTCECRLKNAEEIYDDLVNNAWNKVEERMNCNISPKK